MKHLLFSNPLKKGVQAVVAITLLLFSLGPVGTRVAYAAPPVNDNINSATQINSLIFVDAINTTEATPTDVGSPGGIGGDPDNINCDGFPLNAGYASVWYKYTPSINESISLDTLGSNYDTFITVWSGSIGSLNLVTCNDDTFENQQSELFFTGNSGTTYYIEIAQFSYYDDEPPRPPPAVKGGSLQFHAYITTTNIVIHGTTMGRYYVPPGASLRRSFADVDDGPARITSTNGANIIAALRVLWKDAGKRLSYAELMGLPKERLSTEYWFPWYNNSLSATSMEQGFRIANVSATESNTVQVSVGNTLLDTINLAAGGSTRVNYPIDNGPIKIVCTTCTNTNYDQIIAALRVIWREPGYRSSYSELMGLPKEQLSNEYWFPWYNNLTTTAMEQGFRIANVSATESNTVQVWVGSTLLGTVPLAAGGSTRVTYGVDNGPIRVICTTCTNTNYDQIIIALRVIWKEPGYRSSYSELMGLPVGHLSTEYWFAWYNNKFPGSMEQGFRFGVP